MGRPHEAEQLLTEGLAPTAIAKRMGISVSSVVGYLQQRVGAGSLKISDLLFSISEENRAAFAEAISNSSGKDQVDWKRLSGHSYAREELEIYRQLAHSPRLAGDLYEHIAAIELRLHELVKGVLVAEYHEGGWWREGVPLQIRKDCQSRCEEDEFPASDPFCYTTFINLKTIIDKKWKLFAPALTDSWAKDKHGLLSSLGRQRFTQRGDASSEAPEVDRS